jgi:leader peptidase (prepilin peptidase)/N-methyltransferase
MIVLTFVDIDKKEVPDAVIVFLFLTGFVLNSIEIKNGMNIFTGITGALTGGFIIYLMNFFTDGKIGEGDVKLFAALGFCLGSYAIIELILWSFIAGAAISIALVLLKVSGLKDKIAFVPFIALALIARGLTL